jgi:hypothetical protein
MGFKKSGNAEIIGKPIEVGKRNKDEKDVKPRETDKTSKKSK